MYLEKTIIQKDTCTPMFTAPLFTIARTWKQSKPQSTEEWIKKMYILGWPKSSFGFFHNILQKNSKELFGQLNIYDGILLAIKKNKIMPFAATWMDLEIIILSEVNQTEKDKYHMISLTSGI